LLQYVPIDGVHLVVTVAGDGYLVLGPAGLALVRHDDRDCNTLSSGGYRYVGPWVLRASPT
jgi:hypothetical protein